MKKDVVSKITIVILLCVATIILVIGFVAVNRLSNVSNNEKSEETKYSLYFDKNTFKENPAGKTLTDAKNSGVSSTNLTGLIAFKEPGDSITYTWNIVNNGNVSAKLVEEPVLSGLSENDKQAIEFQMFINDEEVSKGLEVAAGETASAKLVVKYKTDATTKIDPATIQVVSLTLNFAQK